MPYLPTTYSTLGGAYKRPRYHRGVQRIRRAISFFFPPYTSAGLEHLPAKPCVFIANHARAYGPIALCTRLKRDFRPWVHWQVCARDTFAAYAMRDFWPNKPKQSRWLFKLLSLMLSPLGPYIMCGMQAIPVYRDSRSIITFRKSAATLQEGLDIVIFPETDRPHSAFVNDIDAGFADLGRLGEIDPPFVPVYVCPALHTICYGPPAVYDHTKSRQQNRDHIRAYLLQTINDMASALAKHEAVTYRKKKHTGVDTTTAQKPKSE